ncbi:MAG: GAF domain-containing protein [Anaerolineales bacterium]|nr:GAF domain-containing protein [Anaerolineales bacterium]
MAGIFSNKKAFNPEESTRALYRNWRESFAVPLLVGVLIFGTLILIPAINGAKSSIISSLFIAIYIATGVVTFIRFPYLIRISIFILSIFVIALAELATHGVLGDSVFFFLGVIIFSTMLISPKAGIAGIIVGLVTNIAFGIFMLNGTLLPINPNASPAKLDDWLSNGGILVMFGIVIVLGFQRLEKEFLTAQKQIDSTLSELHDERNMLEEKVNERTLKLRRVNEIGRTVTSILDPDELLARAVQLIGSEFDCYYTAIFLLDITGQWADLKEATGDAGKVLRENRHRVDINGKSIIGKVIRDQQVQIALDSGASPIRFDNPLLPYTRSQIVIPLAVGERVIGALEMHSTRENAFQQQDIDTYLNMANEVAIALENSRLFREAQQSLSEMRATQRQYLQSAWATLTSEQDLEYSIGEKDSQENEILVPLALRDQIIGQIQLSSTEDWSPEQRNLIESIATQAALALENARLVEESQTIAARERLANEIIAKVWASANMDGILQTTVRELGRALEAAEVDIEISMDTKNA